MVRQGPFDVFIAFSFELHVVDTSWLQTNPLSEGMSSGIPQEPWSPIL